MKKQMIREETKALPPRKAEADRSQPTADDSLPHDASAVASLHRNIGNQAVQRILAQRSGQEPAELDSETAESINRARGGGQSLDAAVQAQMGGALGADLGDVRVHTSPESDSLNRQLGAKAFTTGRDVFFRSGAYDPHSGDGRQLIAHELTHVVQQGSGAVHGQGEGMTVSAPGDAYEQEADATAEALVNRTAAPEVQMQEEEELVETQVEEEEEEPVQMQEEEELVEMQVEEEEEEEEEEELIQTQAEQEEEILEP